MCDHSLLPFDSKASSLTAKALSSVKKYVKSKYSTKFASLEALLCDRSVLAAFDASAMKFGLGLTGVVLQIVSSARRKDCLWPKTQYSLEDANVRSMDVAGWFDSESAVRDIMRDLAVYKSELDLSTCSLEVLYMTSQTTRFKSGAGSKVTCSLTGLADMVVVVSTGGGGGGGEARAKGGRMEIPINMYSSSSDTKASALTRAAACATLFGSPLAGVVNTVTGEVRVVNCMETSVLSCLTRGLLLTSWCCNVSTGRVPLPCKFADSTWALIAHCGRDEFGENRNMNRLCVLLLNNLHITNAHGIGQVDVHLGAVDLRVVGSIYHPLAHVRPALVFSREEVVQPAVLHEGVHVTSLLFGSHPSDRDRRVLAAGGGILADVCARRSRDGVLNCQPTHHRVEGDGDGVFVGPGILVRHAGV